MVEDENKSLQEKLKMKDNIINNNKDYIMVLEAALYKKSKEYDQLNSSIKELKQKNNELKISNTELKNRENEFLNSKSWKLTKPLRSIKRKI